MAFIFDESARNYTKTETPVVVEIKIALGDVKLPRLKILKDCTITYHKSIPVNLVIAYKHQL